MKNLITKESLPDLKAVIVEYEKRKLEAFELETEMLKVSMAMLEKLEEIL